MDINQINRDSFAQAKAREHKFLHVSTKHGCFIMNQSQHPNESQRDKINQLINSKLKIKIKINISKKYQPYHHHQTRVLKILL